MNLADQKTRDVQQQEQIGRRASIIPENRNTRAPAYSPSGDMRSARRGDGGAAELMRSLGIAQKGLSDFTAYTENKFEADEKENIAEGAADQQLGTVDPVMLEKSDGYRNAVTKGRTMTEFNKGLRSFDEDLRGFIEQQGSPDLAVRQAEVNAKTEEFFHNFAIDPDTKQLKDFMQSPGAMRYLADGIVQTRTKVESGALARIEERFNEEAITHFETNVSDQVALNGTLDLPLALSAIPKTVPRDIVAKSTVAAVTNAAQVLRSQGKAVEAVQLLDSIVGKPLPIDAGVPSVSEGADFAAPVQPAVAGNLPLGIRTSAKNADGSISTVRTISIGTEKGETLIPTVVDGLVLSNKDAIAHFNKTGENFGSFASVADADKYAEALHQYHAGLLSKSPVAGVAPAASGGRVAFEPLAAAVMHVESRGNAAAVSPVGARGPMQTMPGTLRDPGFGVRAAANDSPEELTRVGRDYLKAMLSRYNGDLVLALSAYNAGPGRADKWQKEWAGKSRAQKMALVPFKETKDYVRDVLTRVGLTSGGEGETSGDPTGAVAADPTFRLGNPSADPVTTYEQSGKVLPMAGIEKVGLTADQVSHIRETRAQLAQQVRVEWTRKRNEEQTHNATGMALRLWGQGNPLTTTEIREGIRSGAIDPEAGLGLFGMQQTRANQAQAQADRQLSLSDRAEARAEKEETDRVTGGFYRRILSGELTGPQARSEALKVLPTIRSPKVQAAVGNAILGASNDIEQLALNSAPVRSTAREFSKQSNDAELDIAKWPGMTPSKAAALAPRYRAVLDAGLADYVSRVRDGEDPSAAKAAVAKDMAAGLGRLKPKPRHTTR